MRVKRLLKAGVISALACMVKADSAILTDQTKELLARYHEGGLGRLEGGRLDGGLEWQRLSEVLENKEKRSDKAGHHS